MHWKTVWNPNASDRIKQSCYGKVQYMDIYISKSTLSWKSDASRFAYPSESMAIVVRRSIVRTYKLHQLQNPHHRPAAVQPNSNQSPNPQPEIGSQCCQATHRPRTVSCCWELSRKSCWRVLSRVCKDMGPTVTHVTNPSAWKHQEL